MTATLTDAQALALCAKLRREGWRETAEWIEEAAGRLAAGERLAGMVREVMAAGGWDGIDPDHDAEVLATMREILSYNPPAAL